MDKKLLKKKLRLQTRLRKLSVRLKQAEERKDDDLALQTRELLRELFLEHPELENNVVVATRNNYDMYPGYTYALIMVHSIHSQLISILDNNLSACKNLDQSPLNQREYHTLHARSLMQNMKKGSQTKSMFNNQQALTGYTRHKFYKRSMLVVDSLGRMVGNNEYGHFMARLSNISCICSIGCGPGCDAVGAIAFVKSLSQRQEQLDTTIILLDWTIEQWRQTILTELESILVPNHIYALTTGTCDVRCGLSDDTQTNAEALNKLLESDRAIMRENGSVELFLVSYLLSETRDKWHIFFDDLFNRSVPGTLFLLSDPTAWQLYIWLARYRDHIDVVWLDSSMHRPDLQLLVRRFGPAVVLAMKK